MLIRWTLFIFCLSSAAWALQSSPDLSERLSRALQTKVTFGAYSMMQDSGYDSFCEANQVDRGALPITLDKLQETMSTLVTEYYSQGRNSLEIFNQERGKVQPWGTYFSDSAFPLIFPILILAGFTVIFYLFTCFWIFLRQVCCVQKKVSADTGRDCWRLSMLSVVLLGVFLIGLSVAFGVYVVRSIDHMPIVQCLTYRFHGDVVVGLKSSSMNFIGLNGILALSQSTAVSLDAINGAVKAAGLNIKNANLSTKADQMFSSYVTFVDSINPESLKTLSPLDPSKTFFPDTVSRSKQLFKVDLMAEITSIYNLGIFADQAAKTVETISAVEVAGLKKSLTELDTATSILVKLLNSYKRQITKDYDIVEIRRIALAAMIIGFCIFIFLGIVFLALLYLNVEKKKIAWARYLNYIILLLKTLFLLLFLAYTFLSIGLSQIINFLCYAGPKLMKEEAYNTYLNPRHRQMHAIIRNCLGPMATGSMAQIIEVPANLDRLNYLVSTSGLFLKHKGSIAAGSWAGSRMVNTLADKYGMKESDSVFAGGLGIDAAMELANSKIGCAKDEFRYVGKCNATYTKSQSGDSFSQALNQGYCMEALSTSSSNYDGRYMLSSCVTDAAVKRDNLVGSIIRSINDYRTKTANLRTMYQSSFTTQQSLMSSLQTVSPDLQTVSDAFSSAGSIAQEFDGTLTNSLNCTLIKEYGLQGLNLVCLQLGPPVVIQTILATWISVVFFFYILCMFCGLRGYFNEQEEEARAEGQAVIYKVARDDEIMSDREKEKEKEKDGKWLEGNRSELVQVTVPPEMKKKESNPYTAPAQTPEENRAIKYVDEESHPKPVINIPEEFQKANQPKEDKAEKLNSGTKKIRMGPVT
jgi:hypothetical protein